jgi:Protein of unknown function (DUF3060)
MKLFVSLLLFVTPVVARADTKLEKGAAWDCKKDPVVSIPNGGGKYTFKGPCTSINVGGGKNTLDIESVETLNLGGGLNTLKIGTADSLNIGGAKNTITIDTVGTIDIAGASNTITWKKAKAGDKPVMKGQPDKNTITQGK